MGGLNGKEFEALPRRLRHLTPRRFADFLYHRVAARTGADKVAVLWTDPKSYYYWLYPAVECWDARKDARKYAGPWPIIAHPPCGSWGCLKRFSRQPKEDGIISIDFVHKYGGVVEQPLGSQLFRLHGRPDARIEVVDQRVYGHKLRKRTLLYFVL